MNLHDPKYKSFALVREMLETPGLIGQFDFQASRDAAAAIRETGKLFLTGEGSSRIFPAKNLIAEILRLGVPVAAATEGAGRPTSTTSRSSSSSGPATAARPRS